MCQLWQKRNNQPCSFIMLCCSRTGKVHLQAQQSLAGHYQPAGPKQIQDIQGQTIGEGTIPPDILVTSEKPDIAIIDPLLKLVTIIELTCPWEERLKQAREHNTNKYAPLIYGIQEQGHAVILIPLEIGVRGDN